MSTSINNQQIQTIHPSVCESDTPTATMSELPNKFYGHFATPLEYVISLIRWSLGCIRSLTLTTLYHLKIPLKLIKIKKTK